MQEEVVTYREWRLNSASLGIRMPFNVKSQGGFSVSDLDVLIADDVDKQTSSLCIMQDCDDDGLYQQRREKKFFISMFLSIELSTI